MRKLRWVTGMVLVGALASACDGPKDPFSYAFGKIDDGESSVRRKVATPVIAQVFPEAGAAGDALVLTGEHFGKKQGASTLTVAGVEVAANSWSDTTIEFTVTEALPGGPQDVVVTVGGKASEPFKVGVSPTLTALTPAEGSGGTVVTLRGTNFGEKQGKGVVKAGGVTMQPKSWGRSSVTFTIPDTLDAGRREFTLDIGGVKSNAKFVTVRPVVSTATPARGVPESGFTIAGTNFGGSQAGGKVTFGGADAAVTRWSATSIDVTVPFAATAGAKTFAVTAGSQQSNDGSFTVAAPSLSAASPGYAFAGATVTLTGADFGSAQRGSQLLLDGAAITPLSWSNAQLSFVVPNTLAAGNHTLGVRVGTLTSAVQPLVVRPTVTGVRPQAGAAGTLVTVDGYGFGVTGVVRLGGAALVPLAWSNTAVIFAVAATAPASAVVTVESGGQLSNGVLFTITAPGAPVIQSLTPAAGLAGTTVLVAGQNLGAAAGQVNIGGTLVTPSAWSASLAAFTVPTLPTGTKQVFLLVGGNPTNTLPFAVSTATSPWITSVTPASGNAGAVLTINGVRFGATKGASTVTVGGVVAATSGWSATQIRATVPAAATAGILEVVVTVGGEASNSAPFVLAPAISAVAPTAGVAGDTVTLTGTAFGAAQGASAVYFDGVSAAVSAWSAGSIGVAVPGALAAGAHAVWVVVGGQPSNSVPFTVTSAPAPAIAAVSPVGGGVAGTLVTISGTRFGLKQDTSTLTLGGVLVTPVSWSNSAITFIIPNAPAAGVHDLVVTVNGQASNAWPLTVAPSIRSLTPPAGTASTTLVVAGANLGDTQQPGDALYIGGVTAPVTAWSNTLIVANLPATLTPGPNDVYVVVGGQASNSASFYLAAATQPVITSLTPAAGMAGDSVVAAGANFGAASATLTVGGLSAALANWSDTAIGFTVPALATGTHMVRVTTGAGAGNDFPFTVTTPTSPWITTVAPLVGSTGTLVVVTGARFGAAPGALTIGGAPASIATWSNTTIYASVPALPAGVHAVVVTNAGSENSNSVNFTLRPVINGIAPTPAIADQQVTLTGADFGATQNGSVVSVGGTTAAIDSWSGSSITFRVPTSLAAGTYGVAVRVNGQNSNSVSLTSLGALVITSVNPSSGSGGTAVVLGGVNFGAAQGASTLTLGGAAVTPDFWTPTAITFSVSDLTPAGARAIALQVRGVAANVTSFTVLPSLISVFPSGGPVGTDVTLAGTNFGPSGAVYLGSYAVPTQSWSDTSITFRVPAGYTAGDYPVAVVSGGQTSNALDYKVTSASAVAIIGGIAPTSAQAGATVTLSGVNFGATQDLSTLHFDAGTLTPVAWYDTTVTFNAPAVAPGTYDVFLTVNGTASNKVPFTVTSPTSPVLNSVSPRAGPAGTALSLVGTAFGPSQGGSAVTVGGVAASVGTWSDTGIATSVPAALDAGIHDVVVTVGGEASNAVTFTVRPAITGLNPVNGVAGDAVVITGSSFGAAQGASQVLIDGVAAAVTAWSNNSLTFTVPVSVPAGSLSVVVRVNGQVSNAQTFTVTTAGDPLISALAPVVGSAGTQVVISGTRFGSAQGASSVAFGGVAPTILNWSASSISIEVPGTVDAGTQDVTVTVNGQVSNAAAFVVQPSLTALVPAGGAGGFAVAAHGLNFGAAQGASRIYMGGVSATVTAWANDRVDFTVPAGLTAGMQPVRVEVNGQFSNARNFAYAAPGAPALFALTPAAGMVGASVTASGANFGANATAVSIDVGGSAATPANLTDTSFEFTVPSLPTGTHAVVATVSGTASNAVGFTVTTATSPWITSVLPSSGPVATNLTISGTQFGNSGTLTIGGVAVAPSLWTDTLILAAVPNAVPAGLQGVVVEHAGENSNTVDFALRPNITTVAPASGVAGDTVTVTGTSFGAAQGAGNVTLGGVAATVQSWSDTSVTVQVPAGVAPGNVYLVLTQGGQPSNSMAFTVSSAAAPSIAGLDITFGVAGQTITVSGSRFGVVQGASSLVLGGTVVAPTSWSNTSIAFVVPGDIAAGSQSLVVTVAGQASNTATFTILPTASAVAPIAGEVGTSVTLTGANFGASQGSSLVTVGGTAATVTAWGMNSLTFTVPAVGLGAQPVVVTVGGQAGNAASFFVTSGSGPVITGIAPASGLAGTLVTLSGANFGASGTLTFGGSVVASSAWNATQIQFTAPALAPGSYDVVVDTGTLSNPVAFTITTSTSPWIDTVTPASGVAGDVVTLTGQRFGAFAGASTVTVGGAGAALVGWSDTLLQVRVPAAASAGLRPIVVTVGGEASNSYAFTVRPAITSLSPTAGDIGTALTINGTGFGASGGVTVGGVAAAVQSWSNAAVAVTVPTSLTGGSHGVVVTANGQLSNTVAYLVTTGLPMIASLSPASGTAGTEVTVAGSNFGAVQGANTITVGGVTVTPTSWSGTSIVFTLPAQVPGGANDVVVTVAGVSSPAAAFTVVPAIATATPSLAWAGDTVTVTGSGFGAAQGASTVSLGGISITPAMWTHTALTFALPANVPPGTQTLTLAVGGQTAQTTVDVQPDITNVNPLAATAGQSVDLTGTNFGAAAGTLTVGGVAVLPTWAATTVSFTLPSDVTAGTQAIALTAGGHVTAATITVLPTILAVSPSPAVGGDTVTVTGTNFGAAQGAATVTVFGVAVAPASWSHTAITFSLPATLAADVGDVVVTVGGQSASHTLAIDPTATSAAPSPTTAGTTVTLTGANFGAAQGASTLTLGGTTVAPASWSDTAITFAVPADGVAGSQAVAVSINGRTASTALVVDPTITAMTAAAVAGDTVTLSGTNFGASAAGLTVGGTAVTPAAWTATSISFVVPASIPGGTHAIVVTVNGRTASRTLTVSPNLTGVAPVSGAVGAAVTLTGTGFGSAQGASTLMLAGTALAPTSWSDTSIGFQVPSGVTAGTAQIVLTVGGQSDTQTFTVLPSILSVTPSPASYGAAIVVAGANFGPAQATSQVTLGGVALALSSWSDAQINFTLPATTAGGVHTLAVTVGGQVTTATLTVDPKVASLTPSLGTSGAGITAAGGNFGASQGGSSATLGGVALAPSAWNDTAIDFTVPSNVAAGQQDFVATVGGQASAPVTFTVELTVSGAAPATATGGTLVTVSGTNFGAAQGASTLTLGGVTVTPAAWDHTALDFAVPADVTAGTRAIALTVGGRTGTTSLTIDPSIASVAPNYGGAGTTVTLTGANFGAAQDASSITLGGQSVTVTAWSHTSISFTVPNTVSAGAQTIALTVGGRLVNAAFTVTNSLSGVAPATGTAGTSVTVSGSNFGAAQGGSSIALGGVALVPTSWTDTAIQFTVPNNVTAGVQAVVVTVGGQPTSGSFTVLPSIGAVGSASATGGDAVVLTGANFGAVKGTSTVRVGGVAAVTTAWSHTSVTFTMPNTVTAGTRTIVVAVGGQSASASIAVDPNITSVTPTAGGAGASVTLAGTNFGASQGASTLTLGGAALTAGSWSQTSISFTVPAAVTGGTQPVVVAVNGRTDSTSFTVQHAITSLTPGNGTAGTTVTVAGNGFGAAQGASTLAIGGVLVAPSVWSQTSLEFTVPNNVTAGTQNVTVTVAGVAASAPFTVEPSVTSITPAAGSVATSITLAGTNFGAAQGASSLTVAGVTMSPSSWSDTAIVFALPSNVTAGTQPVVVTVGGQIASTSFTAQPSITTVSPNTGTGGDSITLTGANFGAAQGTSTLSVGGVTVAPAAWSQTLISFTLPNTVTAGTQSVAVTVGGQSTSATLTVDPTLASLTPASGGSGTVVVVGGTNFGDTQGASTLTLGGRSLTASAWNQTSLTFTVPSDVTAGTQPVVVTVGGRSDTANFTVTHAVAGVNPQAGPVATAVTVTGSNFGAAQGASTLTLAGKVLSPDAWSQTAIDFTVPNDVTAGTQPVVVRVNGAPVAATFTVEPSITGLVPASATGGIGITLSGANFGSAQGVSTITVGGVAATASAWGHTSITFTVPDAVTAGTQPVVVTVGGRTAATSLDVAPNITAVTPALGGAGASITLGGTNFGAAKGTSTLTLGGVALTADTWNQTAITFTVPSSVTAGTQPLVVTVNGRSDSDAMTVQHLVTGLTPANGPAGTLVTVAGSGFGDAQGASTLHIGGLLVAPSAWSQTALEFTVPSNVTAGTRNVTVTVDGTAVAAPFTVELTLSGISPASGGVNTAVTLSGANFGAAQGGSTLTVGGVAMSPTSWSQTSVSFDLPAGVTAGTQPVVLSVAGETASTAFTAQPSISAVAPSVATGGDVVTVTGANFGADQGASTLTVAGGAVVPTAWSATSLTFTLPNAVTAGTQTVAVTVGGESVSASLTVDPTLASLSPAAGAAGSVVTVSGTNFGAAQGGSTLTIGGRSLTASTWSATSLTFTVPNDVTAGTQPVVVTVGGRSDTANFTVTGSLSGITPASGTAGTAVTVSGSSFGAAQGASTISIGGVALTPTSWTDTAIDFVVPNNVTAGVQAVVVTVGGQPASGSFTVLPAITAVGSAAATGGDSVVLTGTNFGAVKGASTVTVGGVAAATTAWSHTSLTFTMPSGVTAGTQTIVVTVGGQANSAAIDVDPNITTVTPASGGAGASVTLAGTNFGAAQGAATLTLGGVALTADSWSQTSISFTVPAAVTGGTQPVVVTLNGRSDSATFTVQHAITSLTPGNGTAGTTVTVVGSGFGAAQGASTLSIGGVAITPTVWSQTSLEFTVPNSVTAGTQNVTVTVAGVAVSAPFTVEPSITSITPASGVVATSITLAGTNFGASQGASTLTLGGVVMSPSSWSQTSIVFALPNNVTAGTQPVVVTVGGQVVSTSFTAQPSISTVSPTSGTGGDAITLTGANFGAAQGASTLTVAGLAVAPTAWSQTSISFTLPNTVTAGTQSVAVTVGGEVATASLDVDPAITAVTPASGGEGTAVAISGTNFGATQGVSTLTIGGVAIAPTAWSDTAINFTLPNTVTAGTQPLVVTIGGRTATDSFTVTHAITSLTPGAGTAGTNVTVAGSGFGAAQGASTVSIGGVAVTPTVWSQTSLEFTVPGSVTAGTQNVTVTVAGVDVSAPFTVQPSISAVSPAAARAGASVTVTGTNFGAAQVASTLTLGGVAMTPTAWDHTSISFTLATTVTAGTQTLLVTVGGETASTAFTVDPSITGVAPGAATAGTSVIVSGANLGDLKGASTLTLGGADLATMAWGMTSLTFTVPADVTAGTQALVATVGGRTTDTTFAIDPYLVSLSPAAGTGGTLVTVAAANLGNAQGASVLTFGGTTLTPSAWTMTTLTFAVPATVAAGVHDVQVSVGGRVSNVQSFTLAPYIASLAPATGTGGDTITLAGQNFGAIQGSSTITVGGVSVTAVSWSNSSLTFDVPNTLVAGVHDVVVTVSGQASNTRSLTVDPTIASLTPASGTAGTAVTIAGTNFGAAQGTSSVSIGGVVTAPTAWGATSISFAVPATVTAGVQNVVVTVGGRTSNAAAFTVAPTLVSVSPATGVAGTSVTVSGTNLGATAGTLTVGGAAVTPTAWSMTSLSFTVPSTLAAGSNNIEVTVGGEVSNTLGFTIRPSITSVSPQTGSGGTTLTVSGANFGAATDSLTLGGASVTPDSWSNLSITFTVTNAMLPGIHDVVVTVGAEASDPVTFAVRPALSSLTPAAGNPGESVTLDGTNFGPTAGTVKFGTTTAVVTSWNNLTIVATVPALAAGNYDVSVSANGVTSTTLAYSVTGTYGIASAQTLDCDPVNGIIDHYKITYSTAVSDSTFDGYVANGAGLSTARWSVAGRTNPRLHHGTSLPSACGVDTADDNVHYVAFDEGAAPDTGVKPDLVGTATLVKIAATGKRLYDDTGTWTSTDVTESDGAKPYIYLAVAAEDDVSGTGYGVDVNDTLELRYSESTNAPALGAADLNALVELRDASNVLHSLGAVADRLSTVWLASSVTNDTLRITFANANPTVAVGDKVRAQGAAITDLTGNVPAPVADVTNPPLVTGSFDPGSVGPKVVSAAYYDLDADGYLDHVRLVFDKSLDDTTFPGYVGRNALNTVTTLWQVAGYNNVRIDTYDTVDGMGGANDTNLWLSFDEGAAPDTGLTPDLTATTGSAGLRDADGCYINADNTAPGCAVAAKARLASADVVEGDKAPPVIVRVSGKVGGNRLYVSFSEAVYGAQNAPACGTGGELAAADFTYGNVNAGGATGIASMDSDVCAIDDKQIGLVTTGLITSGDINADYVQVSSGAALYDAVNNAMRATDQRVIIDTTAPYLVAASSFRYGGKYYIRVVYSEPVQAAYATDPANYSVVESPANASCTDFAATPLSVAQVSSTVYDLETGTQCGTATTPDTYYLVTANNILDVNENELIGSPNFATTLGTDPADGTRPRLLEAVSVTPLTVRLTYSEPMRPGDVAGSAECAAAYTAGRRCSDDVDAGVAGTQTKYTINPTLGSIAQVVATANPSVFLLTHQNAQSGGFYTITAYASNAVAAIPVDTTGNLLLGKPDNQVTFQGKGAAILDLEDGPLFSDPFVDGTSFSYAFKYANRVYLGPNDVNSGAFRFEADGLNPTSVAFQGPALNADGTALSCAYAPSFGVSGSISCATSWGPNAETGLVGFDSGTATISSTPYEILMVGAIKDNVSHVYFTQDVDATLNWIACPLGSFTGGGNTKSVQNTYTFADNIYAGISSNHNTQAPILIKTPLTASGGVLSCNTGTDLSVRQVAWIGKGGSPANPAVNVSAVGIDTMIMVPGTLGSINTGVDTFYIANNGGVSKSNGTPTSNLSFTTVLTQTNFANYAASTADNVTLVIDSLQKISPGRKGAPKFIVYKDTFFMARNVASAQTVAGQTTSAGGELWKCSTTCTNAANWSRVFTSSGAGSGTGIERTTNTAVSLLEVSDGYLYVAFDNMADGARVYRTNASPALMNSASFTEFGRVATAGCTNHSGDSGALGGLCYAYQILSDASIAKGAYSYLYLTVGCTLAGESVNGGKCDTDATAAFVPPPVRVLVQRD